jgi:DNA-binding NarL/FixJ family response regulator
MSTRVCIVDDDPGISEALCLLFKTSEEVKCEGSFTTSETALREIPRLKPDVVLMDINLPGIDGIECVRRLRQVLPKANILMLTVYEDSDKIFQSLVAGASGYLLKRTSKEQLLRAIREVQQGGAPMTSDIARKVVQYFHQLPAPNQFETLTPREYEILQHLAKGAMYKEIAAELQIALDTVRKHVRSIYEKLHVRSRTEAVLKFLNK